MQYRRSLLQIGPLWEPSPLGDTLAPTVKQRNSKGRSCVEIKAWAPPGLHLLPAGLPPWPLPPLLLFILLTPPFLQRPPFRKRVRTSFVSNMLCFFCSTGTAWKKIKRGAGKKGKGIHPQNEGFNPSLHTQTMKVWGQGAAQDLELLCSGQGLSSRVSDAPEWLCCSFSDNFCTACSLVHSACLVALFEDEG